MSHRVIATTAFLHLIDIALMEIRCTLQIFWMIIDRELHAERLCEGNDDRRARGDAQLLLEELDRAIIVRGLILLRGRFEELLCLFDFDFGLTRGQGVEQNEFRHDHRGITPTSLDGSSAGKEIRICTPSSSLTK